MLRSCAMKKSYVVSKQQQNNSEMTESLTLLYKIYTVCNIGCIILDMIDRIENKP